MNSDSLNLTTSHMHKRKRADLEEGREHRQPLIWLKPHSKSKEGDIPSNNTSVMFGNLSHLTADDTFAVPDSEQKSTQDVHLLSCSLLNMTFGE